MDLSASSTCKLDEVAYGLVEEFLVVLPLKAIIEEYLFESSKQQEEDLAATNFRPSFIHFRWTNESITTRWRYTSLAQEIYHQ
jgi:hypothetical protein